MEEDEESQANVNWEEVAGMVEGIPHNHEKRYMGKVQGPLRDPIYPGVADRPIFHTDL